MEQVFLSGFSLFLQYLWNLASIIPVLFFVGAIIYFFTRIFKWK